MRNSDNFWGNQGNPDFREIGQGYQRRENFNSQQQMNSNDFRFGQMGQGYQRRENIYSPQQQINSNYGNNMNNMGGYWSSFRRPQEENDQQFMMGGGSSNNRNFNMNQNFGQPPYQDMGNPTKEIASQVISAVLSTISSQGKMFGSRKNRSDGHYDDFEPMNDDNEDGDGYHGRGSGRRSRYSPSRRSRRFSPESNRYSRDRRMMRSPPQPRRRREISCERRPNPRDVRPNVRDRLVRKRSPPRSSFPSRNERFARNEENERQGFGKRKRDTSETEVPEEIQKTLKEPIPKEALFCHICKHGGFSTEVTYLAHLKGPHHKTAASAFHTKTEAIQEYLKNTARLACIRFGSLDSNVRPSFCNVCNTKIAESFQSHKKLREHRAAKRFSMPECCGQTFSSRYRMDEHRLTLFHLMKVYQDRQKRGLVLDESLTAKHAMWTFEDSIKYLKSRDTAMEDPDVLRDLHPFDGSVILGVKYLESRKVINCGVCDELIPLNIACIEAHMRSLEHYNKFARFLKTDYLKRMNYQRSQENGGEKKKSGGGRRSADGGSDGDEDDEDDDIFGDIHDDHIILEEVGEDEAEEKEESEKAPEEETAGEDHENRTDDVDENVRQETTSSAEPANEAGDLLDEDQLVVEADVVDQNRQSEQ